MVSGVLAKVSVREGTQEETFPLISLRKSWMFLIVICSLLLIVLKRIISSMARLGRGHSWSTTQNTEILNRLHDAAWPLCVEMLSSDVSWHVNEPHLSNDLMKSQPTTVKGKKFFSGSMDTPELVPGELVSAELRYLLISGIKSQRVILLSFWVSSYYSY